MNDVVLMADSNHDCIACGMSVKPRAYHPYAACLMFRACHDGNVVDANLQAVVEYGRRLADPEETTHERAGCYTNGDPR